MNEFDAIKLRPFLSSGFGLLLNAPESWVETSTQQFFQVIDPNTNAQFTASAYQNPGIGLEEWAGARLGAVAGEMPYLGLVNGPTELHGPNWKGILAEYRGVFPERDYVSCYLVLCLRTEDRVISFTVTADVSTFEQYRQFYSWLLTKNLSFCEVFPMAAP